MQTVTISGDLREGTGSKYARAARRAGLIPCELYGGDDNVHFTARPQELKSLVYTPDFKIANLTVDGKEYSAIMKSIQFHPVTDQILHIDFLQLVEGKSIKVEVPVRFYGTSPGVKNGGNLTQKLHRISIKTTPDNLVEEVKMDISALNLGQSLRVRDIVLEDSIEILNNPSIPVCSVIIPRALKSAEAGVAAEGEEDTEGAEAEGQEAEAAPTEE